LILILQLIQQAALKIGRCENQVDIGSNTTIITNLRQAMGFPRCGDLRF
jgi:hypothetical protein